MPNIVEKCRIMSQSSLGGPLNGSKECFYIDICIKYHNYVNFGRKKCPELWGTKGGNQISKFGKGEERGWNRNFSKILGGNQSLAHCDFYLYDTSLLALSRTFPGDQCCMQC